ncbi:MAG: hypothetical protein NTW25_11235 [Candidatus Kapabacteria bacterium]|nr:hypothetical protein [Candidatus Kapabacteria bacterium]
MSELEMQIAESTNPMAVVAGKQVKTSGRPTIESILEGNFDFIDMEDSAFEKLSNDLFIDILVLCQEQNF